MAVDAPVQTEWMTPGQIAPLLSPPRSRDCVWGWITRGIDTPAGKIKLKGKRSGGFWYTTLALVEEFEAALTAAGQAEPVSESPAGADRRARADQERARKKLGSKK